LTAMLRKRDPVPLLFQAAGQHQAVHAVVINDKYGPSKFRHLCLPAGLLLIPMNKQKTFIGHSERREKSLFQAAGILYSGALGSE
jgi:hypothetical protein